MRIENLLSFGRSLKDAGVGVRVGQLIDAGRALNFVDIGCRPDFYTALRSNLVSRREDIPLFDRVFESFWTDRAPDARPAVSLEESIRQFSVSDAAFIDIEDASDLGSSGVSAYSPIEILSMKDFNELSIN